jgi:type I restriction enzyme S subunit
VAQMEEPQRLVNQSILAKAFRGELVPQDPNDEPASVLLERIRRQREGGDQGTVKRGRGRPKTPTNEA